MSNASSFLLPTTLQEAPFCASLATQNLSWLSVLDYDPKRAVSVTVACMRALGLIGSQEALHVLQRYQVDRRSGVQKEYQAIMCGLAGEKKITKQQVSLETRISETGQSRRFLVIAVRDQRLLEGMPYYLHCIVPHEIQGLVLSYAHALTDVAPLAALAQLQHLHLSWCSALEDLSLLATLTHLQNLEFAWCPRLKDLSPLAVLTQLHSLRLEQVLSVRDLAPLRSLVHLQHFHLSNADYLTDLSPLTGLPHLQRLDLSCCRNLTDLSPLAQLPQLLSLRLKLGNRYTNPSPLDLSPLKSMQALTEVDLSGSVVEDLTPLLTLPSLIRVRLPYEHSESSIVKKLQAQGIQVAFDGWQIFP